MQLQQKQRATGNTTNLNAPQAEPTVPRAGFPYPQPESTLVEKDVLVDQVEYRNQLGIVFDGVEKITFTRSKDRFLNFDFETIQFKTADASVSAQITDINTNSFLQGIYFSSALGPGYEGKTIINITELRKNLESKQTDQEMFLSSRVITSKKGIPFRLRTIVVPGYYTYYAETVLQDKLYTFVTSNLISDVKLQIPENDSKNIHRYLWDIQFAIPARESLLTFIETIEKSKEEQ